MEFKPLENALISLKRLEKEDFDLLFQVASDAEIWKDHPEHTRYTAKGFKTYFNHLINTNCPFLVFDNSSNQIIGATSYYDWYESQKRVAIGYTFLAMSHRGGKFNTSMKRLMIDYAFRYVDKIIFHVREHNLRSQAALLKIGAHKIKEYPSPHDSASKQFEFAINKGEYLL